MTIERKLLGVTPVSGEVLPEGVGFKADNYLKLLNTQSTFLPGGGSSKSLMFSCWFYIGDSEGAPLFQVKNTQNAITFGVTVGANGVAIIAKQNGTTIVQARVNADQGSIKQGWNHIMFSFYVTSTATRHVYLNDQSYSTTWAFYTNSHFFNDIDDFFVAGDQGVINKRLAHVFFDFDIDGAAYLDLSVLSNRREFIDADGLPVVPTGLSPHIYMKLTDANTATTNSGSLGTFTAEGVLATAERGPNQDNCSASEFDGTNDYLQSGTVSLGSDSQLFTFSAILDHTLFGNDFIFEITTGTVFRCHLDMQNGNRFRLRLSDNGGTVRVDVVCNQTVVLGRQDHLTISLDLSNASKRHIYINGLSQTASWTTYITSANIGYGSFDKIVVGDSHNSNDGWHGSIGELYFNSTYYDLSTDNPFWDSDTNRPNSVRKVIADTGVTPLLALPITGSAAGDNLGSIGDLTVNSGPYAGARGGSEYRARSMFCTTKASDGLSSGAMSGGTSKVFSGVVAFNTSHTNSATRLLSFDAASGSTRVGIQADFATADMFALARTADGTIILEAAQIQSNIAENVDYVLMYSFDMTDSTKSRWYVNGVSHTVTASTFTDEAADFNDVAHLASSGSEAGTNGIISNVYFTTDYIDFSQEANRNMFVDQLGYPTDLVPAIAAGDIPTPLVYMRFEDPASLGDNSGTGGDFTTVNGTVIAGEDFNP